MNKVAEFKKELKDLLEKYNAQLSIGYASGSYICAMDESIILDIDGVDHTLCNGWSLSKTDLD